MASENITRQLSIYINGQEVANTLRNVDTEVRRVNTAIRNLDRDSNTYTEDLAGLRNRLQEVTAFQAEFREEVGGTTEDLSAAGSAFGDLFSGLASGNLTQAAAGFTAVKGAIIATTKSALAFIATPIGLAITALAGIALATKEWYNYNKEVVKANSVTSAITKLSGDALNEARMRSQTLSKMFEQDQEAILETARAMVNEFDITYNEAFDSIEKGFIRGGYASDEFLTSLKEYPTFFAQAGFAVEDFQSLVNTGIDLGIYDDKLPDAIKEFALSVQEQTPAVRDALYNAFGTQFTDNLLAGVKNGSVTVKEALVQISEEAGRLGLNVQQAQQLTADLFRGAGEDAGGAIKIFEAVTASVDSQNKSLSEADQAVKDLTDSEYELAKAKDAFLQSEGFAIWSNKFNEWVNGVKRGFFQVLAVITNSKEELERMNQGSTTKDAIKIGMTEVEAKFLKAMAKKQLDDFKGYVSESKKAMGEKFDFEKGREEFIADLRKQQAAAATELDRKKFGAGIDAILKYQEEAKAITNKFSLEEINAQKEANKKKQAEYKPRLAQEKKDREKAAEEAAKARIEEYKKLAKANLEYYMASHLSTIDAEKQLTREIIAEEQKRLDAMAQERLKVIGIEKETNDAVIAIKRSQGIDLNSADVEYLTEKLKLETENHQAIAELNKQYDEEQKVLAAEQKKADYELAFEEATTKEEEERLKREQQYQDDLDRYRKMLDDKKITDEEYVRFKSALDKKKAEAERLANLQSIQDNLNEMGKLADALVEMFGQSKAAAIATAGINAGLAVTEILKTPSIFPEPLASISRAVQIGGVVARTGKAITQIQSSKAPKRAKFYKGGNTGSTATMGYDEYGPVTGVVHKNEYVVPEAMTQDPQYADVLGWLENRRRQLPGYYQGGNVTEPGTATAPTVTTPETANSNGELAAAINRLNSNLESGIVARTIFGYEELEEMNTMNDELKASGQNGILNT